MLPFRKISKTLSRKEKIAFLCASLIVVLCGAVMLAVSLYRSTSVVPARGGDYTEGVVGQPVSINPILATTEADKLLIRLLFSNVPDVADKIETEKSGRVWQVALKENVFWSDGRKLTSDDIVFTIQKIQDPQTQSPLFQSWQGVAVNRLSELKLQFNLVAPYPFFEENLRGLYILPKHLFADTPAPNWKLSDYNLKPVGSGPYVFSSYEKQPNGFITYYHLTAKDSGLEAPLIRNFALRFFSRAEEVVKAFNSGAIDGLTTMDAETYGRIARPHRLFSYSLPNYYAVFFNQSQSLALQDKNVRRALAQTVNQERLAQKIFGGRALPAQGPVPQIVSGSAPVPVSPDLGQIGAALDADGWRANDQGVREQKTKSGVLPLSFRLTIPDVPFLAKTAEELKSAWSQIGAQVEIETLSPEELASDAIKNRDYQALLYGNVLNPPSDLYAFWHSAERFYPGLNLALYSNKQADQLMDSIRREFDSAGRKNNLQQLSELIAQDYPAVFLYSPQYLFVAGKNMGGTTPRLLVEPADRLTEVSSWYVKTARTLK